MFAIMLAIINLFTAVLNISFVIFTNQCLRFFSQDVLLPKPHLPSTFRWMIKCSMLYFCGCPITWPKYESFLILMALIIFLFFFILFMTSTFLIRSIQLILNVRLFNQILIAQSLLKASSVREQGSTP